jgi:hypothetical protein
MEMVDVLTKLREIANRSPEEIGRAIAAAEKLSGKAVTEEMSEKQKKYFGGGKKDDNKDDSKKSAKGEKPDFLDLDKDGDKEESMKKAAKDKEDKKVDEDVQITLSGSDAVLAEILKLAGQIGAKTSGAPTPVSSSPAPAPAPTGMPSTGPIPSLDAIVSGSEPAMDMPMSTEPMMDGAYDASTTPQTFTMGDSAAVPSGNDINKPKITAPKVSPGDNPLHTAISFD